MSKYRKGSKVSWKWGKGTAEGKIKEIYTDSIKKSLKGHQITRNGSKDNPAYLIEQENGSQIVKLHSELS
ncbi:MAG: DUF2945 domain-containing protein [Sphingobacteriia bacterium]|nr:DUF2945 domain-containing protein [Sphingobacteriia bacterium]